jgi:hypothetical protein
LRLVLFSFFWSCFFSQFLKRLTWKVFCQIAFEKSLHVRGFSLFLSQSFSRFSFLKQTNWFVRIFLELKVFFEVHKVGKVLFGFTNLTQPLQKQRFSEKTIF